MNLDSVTLKSIGLSCPLNVSFSYVWFCYITHTENINYQFTELCMYSKHWYIPLKNIQNITFVSITIDLIKKVTKYWEAVRFRVVDIIFLNSNFFLKTQNLSLVINTVHCMRPSSNAPNPVESREAPPTTSFPDFSEPPWEAPWVLFFSSF